MQTPYLDRYPVLRTADPEEARNALRAFGVLDFDLLAGADGFFAATNFLKLSSIGFSYCSYQSSVQTRFSEADYVRQQFGLRGLGSAVIGGNTIDLHPERSCILPNAQGCTINFGALYQQLVIRIDTRVLLRKLAGLTGSVPSGSIEFETLTRLDTEPGQSLQRLVLMYAGLFSSASGAAMPQLVLDELEQTLAIAFLCCNRHNFSGLLDADPSNSAPWHVKRAEDYIETHWDSPITVEKLAEVTNTSARSLFRAFKTSRGYSPMAFAKQFRLKRARAMLQLPQADTSVSGVAFACGFSNLGHFAKDYRAAFRELPSATLRRGKAHTGL